MAFNIENYMSGGPWGFAWPGCCCEVEGCDIASDDFNRPNSDDPGASWVEACGDFDIENGRLKANHTTALVYWPEDNPYGSNNQVNRAKIYNYVDGTKYRLLCRVDHVAQTYYFAEWHYVDSSNMYFRIGHGGWTESGGDCVFDDTVLEEIGPSSPIAEGTLCEFTVTDLGQLCMQDDSSRITICDSDTGSGTGYGSAGEYVGLAIDATTSGGEFDDWSYLAHYEDNPDCPTCDCSCEGNCIPPTLTATVEAINECPALDGDSWTITEQEDQPTKFGDEWSHTAFTCDNAGAGGTEDIRIRLRCGSGGPEISGLLLDILDGAFVEHLTESQDGLQPDESVSTCDPISLRYGPFTYGSVSGCFETTCCNGTPCGTDDNDESLFYIWITE